MKSSMNSTALLLINEYTPSLSESKPVIGNKRNILKINVSTVLFVISAVKIIKEYNTANMNVYHNMEVRKEKCHTPVLKDIISQIIVIRYVSAENTIITPPAYFPNIISLRETGLDKINSTVPFSNIEGINDDVITINSVIMMKNGNCDIICTSNHNTKVLKSKLGSLPINCGNTSTGSRFITSSIIIMTAENITKIDNKTFFAIASFIVPYINDNIGMLIQIFLLPD